MEGKIYSEAIARLNSSEAISFINNAGHDVPLHFAWFEDQVEQSLDESENKTYLFDFPAVFFQFNETKYTKGNGMNQEAEGEMILHIAQRKQVDGIEGAADHGDYKKLVEYAYVIADLLNGYKLDCSAKPFLTSVLHDHLNRPVMVDKVTFSWSGRRIKPSGVPL